MEYTLQALAKEMKITPRTLRHYDQIGLLQPRIRMANGRSLYGLQEVILLCQILLLRDFGLPLEKIRDLLHQRKSRMASALKTQKMVLLKQQRRLKKNLELIEFMIQESNQEKTMDNYSQAPTYVEAVKSHCEQMQCCYDPAVLQEQAASAFEILRAKVGEEYYQAFREKASQVAPEEARLYGGRMGQFLKTMKEAMEHQWPVEGEEVQGLVQTHWEALQIVYPKTHSRHIYLAICDQLFRSPLTESDKTLAPLMDYITKATGVFAERYFSQS